MTEVRCPGCGHFLLKYQGDGDLYIEAPCKRCKATVEVKGGDILYRPRVMELTPAAP